jgi:predicted HTH transcriptional regulator
MAMARANADLQELLARPYEALDIEIKGWLDLNDANQRADLAKALLTIANHGGGFVIMGLDENEEGQFSAGSNRPADLSALSQDDVQNAIQKYLDPAIQCQVAHVAHPDGHGAFPIVTIPGGHRTPIKAKADSPDGKLVAHRTYIRRPGPKSEEPQTATEWDQLFERCIRFISRRPTKGNKRGEKSRQQNQSPARPESQSQYEVG